MRSFILFTVLLSWVIATPLYAVQTSASSAELFSVVKSFDSTFSEVDQSLKKPDLDQKIQQGMKDLLVRLTGDIAVLEREDVQQYITQPKSWLSAYHFESRKEDGVAVGLNLVLNFDAQRLLKAFQDAQILIWPYSQRPKTMLMGSFLSAGSLINLTPENLNYRPDIDFRGYPKLLALPYVLAEKTEKWIYPITGGRIAPAMSQDIRAMLMASGQNYLLSFQIEQNLDQPTRLFWKLFSIEGQALGSAQIEGEHLQALMQDLFNRLIAAYSYTYRESANVLNTAQLSIEKLMSAQQLIEIETFLRAQKPKIHQVSLTSLASDKAVFEVVYQGRYTEFLGLMATIENTVLLQENALTGKINLRLRGLGDVPETQLIDLSKEFEANVHQQQLKQLGQ